MRRVVCHQAGPLDRLTIDDDGDGVEGWKVGDRVMAMPGLGGFASRVTLPAPALSRVPDALPLDAACFIQSYCTALFALTRRTTLAADGGGVGLAAIDVASASGADVLAAASTPEVLAALLDRTLSRKAGVVP